MEIREVVDLDLLKAYHEVESASHEHDFVALPADPLEELVPLVEGHQPADEHVTLWTGTDGDVAVASISVSLPTLDNLTTANLALHVHPDHRRRGHGRAALAFALDQVRAAGRSRVFGQSPYAPDGADGPAFPLLRSSGARLVNDDLRRLLDLRAVPVGPLPAVPEGYRLVQWVEHAPEELLDGLAYLSYRMVLDAPLGDMGYEPEVWDAARFRAAEDTTLRQRRTRLGTAAVHEQTGAVAGVTELVKNQHRHDVVFQWETIVDPEHRGHGLGLVLKAWNHHQLVARHPEARWITTWNATSNTFMVAVNEALGFTPAERWAQWQLDL